MLNHSMSVPVAFAVRAPTRVHDIGRRSGLAEDIQSHLLAFVNRRGITLLRVSLGLVYFWFGTLKFFDGQSPAELLAGKTLHTLSLGMLSPATALPLLATWEALLGLSFLLGTFPRATTAAALAHLGGTVTPLFFFPGEVFIHVPYAPTMLGQYIIKNLILAAAILVVGAAAHQHRELAAQKPQGADRVPVNAEG